MENLGQARHNDQNKPCSPFFSSVFFMTSLESDRSSPVLLQFPIHGETANQLCSCSFSNCLSSFS